MQPSNIAKRSKHTGFLLSTAKLSSCLPSAHHKKFGTSGEDFAADFLIHNGYQILRRNYRTKIGEIDIVACEGKIMCFVEVKSRLEDNYASAFEAVNMPKQKKLTRLALQYCQSFKITDMNVRFDVAAVYLDSQGNYCCKILKNAFDAVY